MLIAAASNTLILLAALACPVGMGLMMFFMGRGMMSGMKGGHQEAGDRSLTELKAEQARLAEKIEALEARQAAATVEDDQQPEQETEHEPEPHELMATTRAPDVSQPLGSSSPDR